MCCRWSWPPDTSPASSLPASACSGLYFLQSTIIYLFIYRSSASSGPMSHGYGLDWLDASSYVDCAVEFWFWWARSMEEFASSQLGVQGPFSAQIWLYQRKKVRGGELSLPTVPRKERPAIYKPPWHLFCSAVTQKVKIHLQLLELSC